MPGSSEKPRSPETARNYFIFAPLELNLENQPLSVQTVTFFRDEAADLPVSSNTSASNPSSFHTKPRPSCRHFMRRCHSGQDGAPYPRIIWIAQQLIFARSELAGAPHNFSGYDGRAPQQCQHSDCERGLSFTRPALLSSAASEALACRPMVTPFLLRAPLMGHVFATARLSLLLQLIQISLPGRPQYSQAYVGCFRTRLRWKSILRFDCSELFGNGGAFTRIRVK